MRFRAPGPKLGHMLDGTPIELVMEVEPRADPIAGSLRDDLGHSFRFSGWLGLAAALEELIVSRPDLTDRRRAGST